MPQIDFYVLSDAAPDAHLRYACRLAEQAAEQSQRVFIRTADADSARRIDDLLWTFGDRSFLPHEIANEGSPSHARIKVLIGSKPPAAFCDTVINLGQNALLDIEALPRIVEIVPADAERKKAARERFKVYRERGIEPQTHTV